MLPDFIKARADIRIGLKAFFKERIRFHSPGLEGTSQKVIHEGTGTTTINAESNFEHDMNMESHHAETTIGNSELLNDPSSVYDMLDKLAQQMAEQQSRMIFDTVSEVTERTGNVYKRTGVVVPETILEMFEKTLISFDENGRPNVPAIHAGPHMIPEIKAALLKIQNDPKYTKQFDQLLIKKKKEWDDRENNRKLVG